MITTLSNGVRLSDHHPYGRTWRQFILEEVNKEANREDMSAEIRLLPVAPQRVRTNYKQFFTQFIP